MSDGFVQRGGLWVLAQGALLLAVAGLGMAYRTESKHLGLLVGGLLFLTASAGCGIAGAMALGRNLTPFPKPTTKGRFVDWGIYGWYVIRFTCRFCVVPSVGQSSVIVGRR